MLSPEIPCETELPRRSLRSLCNLSEDECQVSATNVSQGLSGYAFL